MADKSLEQLQEDLHLAVAEELLRRVQAKDAKPADIANAIAFLKANRVTDNPRRAASPLEKIREALRGVEPGTDEIPDYTH